MTGLKIPPTNSRRTGKRAPAKGCLNCDCYDYFDYHDFSFYVYHLNHLNHSSAIFHLNQGSDICTGTHRKGDAPTGDV